jgi:peptidoglycan hydrolase CwlO-like protein
MPSQLNNVYKILLEEKLRQQNHMRLTEIEHHIKNIYKLLNELDNKIKKIVSK